MYIKRYICFHFSRSQKINFYYNYVNRVTESHAALEVRDFLARTISSTEI